MNTEHTPGPWAVKIDGLAGGFGVEYRIDAGGGTVALLNTVEGAGAADARLIAAAPELLEAARVALRVLSSPEKYAPDGAVELLSAALANARRAAHARR